MSLDASFFFFFLRELERKRVVCFDFLSLKGGSNVHREREREREAVMIGRQREREGEGKEAADCEWIDILGVSRCRWSSCNL